LIEDLVPSVLTGFGKTESMRAIEDEECGLEMEDLLRN
jgi:hypothetical protein